MKRKVLFITIIAILILITLNPTQRLRNSHDAKRTTDVNIILTSIHRYIIDNKGKFPGGLSAGMTEKQIGTSALGCTISTGGCSVFATACVDLTYSLSKYLKSIPIDPLGNISYTGAKTGYSVIVDSNNIVTVKACGAEGGSDIFATK